MTDLVEYQQMKLKRSKAMDTTPGQPSRASNTKSPALGSVRKALLQTSNRSTPGGSVRSSTPDPEQSS